MKSPLFAVALVLLVNVGISGFVTDVPGNDSPVKVMAAKRTKKLKSPFGVHVAKNQQTDVMLLVKIKGVSPEEFDKIKNEKIYVMAGERQCELEYRLTFERGEHELAFAIPKNILELRLLTGDYSPTSFKAEETISEETESPIK